MSAMPETAVPVPETTQLNPVVSNELFVDHPEAAYWIGVVADSGTITKPELYDAEARIRATVYIKQMGFLGVEHADGYGRENDKFDDQSVHLVAVENVKATNSALLIGTGRMILKRNETEHLPIESDFAEVFSEIPTDIPAVEVSRFISRHENQMVQHSIAVAVMRAITYQIQEQGIDTAYFEIERPLLRLLKVIGLPLHIIGDVKEVVEPGGVRKLYPIKITPSEITDSVTNDAFNKFTLRDFFKREEDNGGLGYFPDTLTGGQL